MHDARNSTRSPDVISTGSSGTHVTSSRSIPVCKDARTFEQRQSDIRSTLMENRSGRTPTMSSTSSWNKMPLATGGYNEDWDREINRWLDDSNKRWQNTLDSWSTTSNNRLTPFEKHRFDMEVRTLYCAKLFKKSILAQAKVNVEAPKINHNDELKKLEKK
ncbi:hypothetical protein Ciccas_000269 [Cichlidogyrus casuarinus]|uniref:Uncharacterized protein n=1 Tax=Cichlidogyrus casuarinus TaxID=1844966 RepID=A0ABD2QPK0_9PLAT